MNGAPADVDQIDIQSKAGWHRTMNKKVAFLETNSSYPGLKQVQAT